MKICNIIGSSYCIYCWLFLILYPHFNLTCLPSLRRLCRDHQALPSTNSAPSAGLISRKGRLHLFMISLICLSLPDLCLSVHLPGREDRGQGLLLLLHGAGGLALTWHLCGLNISVRYFDLLSPNVIPDNLNCDLVRIQISQRTKVKMSQFR